MEIKTLNTIKAIKAQAKRKNFWLLTLISALSITTIVGLLHVNTAVQNLELAELNYNEQTLKHLDQSNEIAAIEIEFKTQVHEWNNLLLRGHDPVLYKTHWQLFEQCEARVHTQLQNLHPELLTLKTQESGSTTQPGKPGTVTDPRTELMNLEKQSLEKWPLSDKIAVLMNAHTLIGRVYREALAHYPLEKSAGHAFDIDKDAGGIEHWLTEQFVLLHQQSIANQESMTAQTNTAQQEELHNMRLHLQRTIAWVVAILLVNFLLLIDRLRSSAKELEDVTKQADATIYELAYSDSLTGLPNRHLFSDRLDHAIAVSRNTGNYGGLIFIDLDNFKTLNDTMGHALGDLLLIEVAQRLKHNVRTSDTVARLGGDEFVVVLDALHGDGVTAAKQAGTIAEKICLALAQPYHLDAHLHHGSASIGVALFCHGDTSSEELIKRADTAMYQAKRAGRHTVRFYDQYTQNALEARSDLEHGMHTALADNQFELHYQVQVDRNNRPVGAEALLRWHHPELGMLHPMRFIGLAEENDLIIPIGSWVLSTACAQLKSWESSPLTRDLTLSINVSAAQLRKSKHWTQNNSILNSTSKLRKPTFVEQVQKALAASGINPARLKLEITESMAQHDIEYTIETLLHLKSLGVGISMDDFGTGHSSLAHLKRMPLDQIKIDQSFVREIVTDPYDQAIVRSMVDMANSVGIQIIAEGVETQAQEAELIKQGCLSFQGHLFGEPLPAKDFDKWLTERA